jgi:nucleoside-diphosphate-sugar epimerase
VQNKAVVVGALGVIGRYLVERLVEEPDWRVVGLSRRKATDRPRYRHIAVDLLDPEDTKRKLAELTDVTHVFYAAFQATPGSAADFASNTGPNREMLVNSVTAIDRAAPHLKRVVLVYQVLWRAPWTAEVADARNRSAPHAARLLLRSVGAAWRQTSESSTTGDKY